MSLILSKLEQSLQTGYINRTIPSYSEYLPQLIVNDKKEGKKVLTSIIQELNDCDEFWFSAAFITSEGVISLLETLIELEKKNIKGKILVSQYLNFTQPEALKKLLKFKNIELKISVNNALHSKGYLFKKGEVYDLIIGSSNLTSQALSTNAEWNLKISATPLSHIIFSAIKEFSAEYKKGVFVDNAFIANYEVIYQQQVKFNKVVKNELIISTNSEIVPNSMQLEALKKIEQLRIEGKKRALLISATGSGKTYLSAFDTKKFNPKKFLFVVHRLNIAKASMKAFKTIFGNSKTMGLYSGGLKELDVDFVFSTIQTISIEENLTQFDPNHFEYIVIDETHRASAKTYKKIINYFNPDFLLGMTATPERTDGEDIFKVFDYNIAYEIRLHKALEEDILSPFHYYGVTDITVGGKILEENSDFKFLASEERIDRIIEKANIYGCDNGNIRGLIFCSKLEECKALSEGFNRRGYKTIALSGENNEEERVQAIIKLESDDKENQYDYIFTYDIFNEGIDIPKVNQIIMLRPTQSAIVFVQQLGRGLRKAENKEYLTVIDFIGNYKNNFLVPIALYGDTSYNKDSLRKLITSGSSLIPGTSTINFDLISKEKIFEAIDNANMQLKKDLINDYNLLKFRIGRIPMMMDFLEQGGRDPYLYVSYSKSYFNFTSAQEESLISKLTIEEIKLLELFSSEINNAKRVEESFILLSLLECGELSIIHLKELLKKEFEYDLTDETVRSCLINLNFQFIRKEKSIITLNNESFILGEDLKKALENHIFYNYLLDSINCSIETFRKSFDKTKYVDGLILYNKYSRKDVCRILNWKNDVSSTVYGYRTNNEVTPCFVTYNKANNISETTNYNDYFIDQNTFAWESRSKRKISSQEIQNVINSKRILLFIKKEDGEGSDFYYVGDVEIINDSIKQDFMPISGEPVVHFKFSLKKPVDDSLYNYLISNYSKKEIKTATKPLLNNSPIIPFKILPDNEVNQFVNCIPLYDIKGAAGYFSDLQVNLETQWITLSKPFNYSEDYFVCQVIGESMNKIIPSGSWCLFKKDSGGSRTGKIVLVHQTNIQDSDFGLGFTVKLYESNKTVTEDSWSHTSIILKPQSTDSKFEDLVLTQDELVDFKVIGVFVKLL
jgi:superfamily II DNA or RNA helicase/HKD family nuclease